MMPSKSCCAAVTKANLTELLDTRLHRALSTDHHDRVGSRDDLVQGDQQIVDVFLLDESARVQHQGATSWNALRRPVGGLDRVELIQRQRIGDHLTVDARWQPCVPARQACFRDEQTHRRRGQRGARLAQ